MENCIIGSYNGEQQQAATMGGAVIGSHTREERESCNSYLQWRAGIGSYNGEVARMELLVRCNI